MIGPWRTNRIRIVNRLLCSLLLLSACAWGGVFVRWTNTALPRPDALGFTDLLISATGKTSPSSEDARQKGYRVFLEVPLEQANDTAVKAEKSGLAGIVLNVGQSERDGVEESIRALRSVHPKLKFLVLGSGGKQPQMRGTLVIRRNAVLEVSSPTAQPWIDMNLALVKIDKRSRPEQTPLYTFSWTSPDSAQQSPPTAMDYSLAVAEAGAFQANLILEVDEPLQKALNDNDPQAWTLWKQVKSYADFYSHPSKPALDHVANVAVVLDDLDPTDETMNLLARHNMPFKVFRPADLKSETLSSFDVIVMFPKPDRETSERIAALATQGKIVVIVDAQGSYPWQKGGSVRLNEKAVSYATGKGRVIELSEPVTDPETFAQDIRRLLGNQNMLVSVWNGLTTIAVPYGDHGPETNRIEFVNYATDPIQLQVKVKGEFNTIRFESPGHECCSNLQPVKRNGFTEFVIPELRIAGRVYLDESDQHSVSHAPQ